LEDAAVGLRRGEAVDEGAGGGVDGGHAGPVDRAGGGGEGGEGAAEVQLPAREGQGGDVGVGFRRVERRVEGAGVEVEGRQPAHGLAADVVELAGDVEAVLVRRHQQGQDGPVGVGGGGERRAGDGLAGVGVELHEV